MKAPPWPIKRIAELTQDRRQERELRQGSWTSTSWLYCATGAQIVLQVSHELGLQTEQLNGIEIEMIGE